MTSDIGSGNMNDMSRYTITSTALLLPILLITACERPPEGPARQKYAREVMGTFAELTAYAADRDTARAAVEAGYDRLDDVNRLMSDYLDDSEISRLNARSAGEPLKVAPETFACLQTAAAVSAASGGAFDITCRPLVQLWKAAGEDNTLPSDADIEAVLERVGWQKLKLDEAAQSVTKTVDDMQIDLGAIAKGYALDLAADAMQKAGATAGIVDVGGDVRAFGTQPETTTWRVGIRHPFSQGRFGVIDLDRGAVATSGVQQRFITIEGQRYSHIIDPRTGRPAEQAPSVTVIAPDGITADAWATAFSVLSLEEGRALADSSAFEGIEVLWLTRGPTGDVVTHQTAGLETYLRDE